MKFPFNRTFGLSLAIWLFALGLISSPAAYAEQNAELSGQDMRDVFFDDRVFKGDDAKQESFFEIGKGQQVAAGSHIDLHFSHSSTILPEASSLNVFLDDVPLASLKLDETNENDANWKIDISDRDLQPGFHKITIWPRLKVSLNGCEDPSTTSAWLVLYKKSQIVLNFASAYETADFALYPSPFVERGGTQAVQTILVVPDQIDQDEFVSAAAFSQFFSAQSPGNRLNVPIYTESDVTNALLSKSSAVWIGKSDRWTGAGKAVIEAMEKSAGQPLSDGAYIGLVQTPGGSTHTSLVVSGDGERLRNAAEIMTNESLYRQLVGTFSKVPDRLHKTANPKQVEIGKPYTVTLEQIGYNNLALQGVITGNLQINYTLPGNWELRDGAKLHLAYSHSNSIIYNKSVMKISMNGIPVKSAKLVEKTSDGGSLDIDLDRSIIGNNRTLSVMIDFEFVNPEEVTEEGEKAVCALTLLGDWAVIDKASSFTFTPIERNSSNLQSLPYPFIVNGKWDKTTFVFDQIGTQELGVAMTLIGKIGANAAALDDLELVRSTGPGIEDKLRERNLIYIGTSDTLPGFMKELPDDYVDIQKDKFVSKTPQVELLDRLQRNSAIMQLSPSPMNGDRSLLLLGATSKERLRSLSSALSSEAEQGKIAGKLVAIDDRNIVYAFPATDVQAVPVEAKTNADERRWSDFTLSGPEFAILAALVAAVVYGLYRLLRYRN